MAGDPPRRPNSKELTAPEIHPVARQRQLQPWLDRLGRDPRALRGQQGAILLRALVAQTLTAARGAGSDEAGTVEGTHSKVPAMQETLAAPKPVNRSREGRVLYLDDPGHDPDDFLRLLSAAFWPILDEPLRSTLPPVFDGVEPSPAVAYDCLGGTARQAQLASQYGRYRKAGLRHAEALARAEADHPPVGDAGNPTR
ncbi:MAG: hypothetical protein GDA41_11270 [Rhodospirillales bacterium]|nr:hypothetical protein [Rhodospirillales bacterium]